MHTFIHAHRIVCHKETRVYIYRVCVRVHMHATMTYIQHTHQISMLEREGHGAWYLYRGQRVDLIVLRTVVI